MSVAPKILVADDDQALSRTLSWILKENGYDVFTAPGGEHLFEHLTAEQFDLLLLDIMLPKVDGLHLLQRAKADPGLNTLPGSRGTYAWGGSSISRGRRLAPAPG